MTLRQDFDIADAAGFSPALDPASLRRQFRVSVAVVLMLAGAIAGAATSFHSIPVTTSAAGIAVPHAPVNASTDVVGAVRS